MTTEPTTPAETSAPTSEPAAPAVVAPAVETAQSSAPAAAEAAPVDYSALKLPEGYALEDAALADFRTILETHKLPLEAGSALLEFNATLADAARKGEEKLLAEQRTAGVAELKADAEFGGVNGARYEQSLGEVRRVLIDNWGHGPADELIKSGLLDSPSFTRGLLKVAKAMAPAPLVPGSGAAPASPVLLDYPSMREKAA